MKSKEQNHEIFSTIEVREFGRGQQTSEGKTEFDAVYERNLELDEEIRLFHQVNRKTKKVRKGVRARFVLRDRQPTIVLQAEAPTMFIHRDQLVMNGVALLKGEGVVIRPFTPTGFPSNIPNARITHLHESNAERKIPTTDPPVPQETPDAPSPPDAGHLEP